MTIKRFVLGLIIVLVFAASCLAGYFTLKYNNSIVKDNIVQNPIAKAANVDIQTLINEKTKITYRYKYLKGNTSKGDAFTKEVTETAGKDIVGMNRISAEKYFKQKDKDIIIMEFTDKNVLLTKDIDSWPPGCYVIKSDNQDINVYLVDANGGLKLYKNSGIGIDALQTSDTEEIKKGMILPSLDKVNAILDEYES